MLLALCLFVAQSLAADESNWLSQDSVVLIVGATTSLLGSEVALALYRLFACRVVLVDDLDAGNMSGISEALFKLEFQRQALFRVWQEIDSRLDVYRMNPRSIIPDIDPGTTVDRLAHVFAKHRPTHVLVFPETPECYRGETDDAPPRAGMLEGILQHALTFHQDNPDVALPHVVWTSSEDVYPATGVWKESDNPPVPLTKDGAESMVDEVIARSFDDKGIPSVALRISQHVYGPFQELDAPLFSLMENILSQKELQVKNTDVASDFLYVDDAVDAVLAALQLPNQPHTFAVNVASGESAMNMEQVKMAVQNVASGKKVQVLKSDGRRLDVSLAKDMLNFHPRVSLTEGLQRTLAWHYDRMFPYGAEKSPALSAVRSLAQKHGIASCSDASDTECLKGVPVLPCASECSHPNQCHRTAWDTILSKLESWTASCPVVLYTVHQSATPDALDSWTRRTAVWPDSRCNIAFVLGDGAGGIRIQNKWTMVPVQMDPTDLDAWMVPLFTPAKMFPRSQWAIYTSPNVAWDDLDSLVEEVSMQPGQNSGGIAMMMGYGTQRGGPRNSIQRQAYRALYIKMAQFFDHDWLHDGFLTDLDAESWIVHRLGHQDSEQLRCDISKEISGWKGVVDFKAAAAFVFGVHDLMSQVIARQIGTPAWWHDPKSMHLNTQSNALNRRLQEEPQGADGGSVVMDGEAELEGGGEEVVEDLEEDQAELHEVHHFDQNGFGVTHKSITAGDENDKDAAQKHNDKAQETIDESSSEKKLKSGSSASRHAKDDTEASERDAWLGVLSSSNEQMFIRLVSSESVGAFYLDSLDPVYNQ